MKTPLIFALTALGAVAVLAFVERGAAMALAALIGGGAGVALYHASFGFTAAWRRIVREKRGAGLRAQMLLIMLTCLVSFPLIAWGTGDFAARGNVLPMGVASAIGAFVFGAGMQVGGGCASGTLFTVGGGSTRMLVVLIFFITGSVVATAHWEFWTRPLDVPAADPLYGAVKDIVTTRLNNNRGVSLIRELGVPGALALMALVLGLIALISAVIERRAHGALEPRKPHGSWLTGPWSLIAGAVALALVGVATFLSLGRPWGVTAGFALWGAQAYEAMGGDVSGWIYWSGWRSGQLERSLFANGTSVMNFGIVFGAMAAACLAGKWSPGWKLSKRDLITAIIGGLMMGYGARLAYGCNIGAYLGGLVSGSLHGWWWLIWGFAGSYLGVWMRGRLSMDPPLSTKPAI
ncbi:MAG: YeeE/YedE family protein [Pseudomonadota bacterium]